VPSAINRKTPIEILKRRFGSERDVFVITGISPRTLQKDRLLGKDRFPWYKVGGKVLYDLAEIEQKIRAGGRNVAA
jgi:hypothetical protein